jgi:uncharacterized protein Usg
MEKIFLEFKNEKVNTDFKEKGFVQLPLLNDDDCRALQEYYKEIKNLIDIPSHSKYSTAQHTELLDTKMISEQIFKVVLPKLDEQLNNYDALVAAYLVKPAKQAKSEFLDWHQALSYVDETKYEAAMLWIALEDEPAYNWDFKVLPQTHLCEDVIRTSFHYPLYFEDYLQKLASKNTRQIHLKKGDAFIFHNRLLNYSAANETNIESKALQIPIKVAEATWQHYHHSETGIACYHPNLDFYLNFWKHRSIDEACFSHNVRYTFPKMDAKAYYQFLAQQAYPLNVKEKLLSKIL